MPTATLTSKGQITVPKEVRAALGLRTGDRLAFQIQEDGTVIMAAETVDLMSLAGMLKRAVKGKRVSIEEMNDVIRDAANRR